MGLEFALIHSDHKAERDMGNEEGDKSSLRLVGSVTEKLRIVVDDIADTSHTLTQAATILKSHGATKIYALVTHGILSSDARARIEGSEIDHNTVPQKEGGKLRVLDVAPI